MVLLDWLGTEIYMLLEAHSPHHQPLKVVMALVIHLVVEMIQLIPYKHQQQSSLWPLRIGSPHNMEVIFALALRRLGLHHEESDSALDLAVSGELVAQLMALPLNISGQQGQRQHPLGLRLPRVRSVQGQLLPKLTIPTSP